MKLKKIISAISAFAMVASMAVVANAASLGGNPTVTATFDSYEKVSDTVAFAYVNVTIDMSAAEALEVYSNELDETTWEEVVKGNGITTMGSTWAAPAGFTYTKAKSTIPAGLTVNATSLAFGPKTSAEEFWTESVTTVKLAYRVNDFDAKGDFTLNVGGSTVDGKNSEEGNVWSYADAAGTITLTSCSIPSYNEWSKPAEPEEPQITINNKYVFNFTADAGQEVMVKLTRANGIESDLTYSLPELVKGEASIFGLLKVTDKTVVSGDKFDISVVDANRNPVREITTITVE